MNIVENTSARVVLKPGREKSIYNRHPWLFSGAVEKLDGRAKAGDVVPVYAAKGEFLGKGFWNPHSAIRVRLLTFQQETVDVQFFRARLQNALALRKMLIGTDTNAFRLVNSDGDLLSGLIVDQYDDTLVIQCTSSGMQLHKPMLIDLLKELCNPAQILERSEGNALRNEGLQPVIEWLLGGETPMVDIIENGLKFRVDVKGGQKTGFFLDQRGNRELTGKFAAGKSLLNCFSYSGAFSVYAAVNGATTTSVDISEPAIALAKENFKLNDLPAKSHDFLAANVFDYLREDDARFDMIVLDPPAFVKQKAHIDKGARGYKDINRLAIQKLNPGGLLLTCSCSAYVDRDLFRKIIYSAAQEVGRDCRILAQPAQPADHPINIFHPEGEYLKTLLLQVD